MGTVRISSTQSTPSTGFYLEADIYSTEASYSDHGRWRVRFYIRCNNLGTTGSFFNDGGTQIGRYNGNVFDSHTADPFLPSGYATNAVRWHDGPTYVYVNANSNGYWSGTSTSLPLNMTLDYGSVNTTPTGSLSLPRIARAPGKPGNPVVSNISPTGASLSWGAAERGNANIDRYRWQISTTSAFSTITTTGTPSGTSGSTSALTPATPYFVRVRAENADGNGAWSNTTSFTTFSGAYVSVSGAWVAVPVYVSNGTTWNVAELSVSNGTTWQTPL